MANKHGAGCACCEGGQCTSCDKTITTISVTLGSRTFSWSVNKNINEINGCCLLFNAGYSTTYDVIDYYNANAWDGTSGECWKAFNGADCCSGSTGGGGGGGAGGPGGPPIPAGVCIPCVEYAGNVLCDDTYKIKTYQIRDLQINVKVLVEESYSLSVCFKDKGDGTTDISFLISSLMQYKVCGAWSFELAEFLNTNCPKTLDCATFTPTSSTGCDGRCDIPECVGFGRDPLLQELYVAYFDCESDAPNWVESSSVVQCASPCSLFFEPCEACFEFDCLCGNVQSLNTEPNPSLFTLQPSGCGCFAKVHSAGWQFNDPNEAFNRPCNTICGTYSVQRSDFMAEVLYCSGDEDIYGCQCQYNQAWAESTSVTSPGSCWFADAEGPPASPLPIDWCQRYHDDCCVDDSIAPSTTIIDLPNEPADTVTVTISCS
jgi:hypothetical protein